MTTTIWEAWSPAAIYQTIARSYGEEVAKRYLVPVKSMIEAGIHVAFEMDRDSYIWGDIWNFSLPERWRGRFWELMNGLIAPQP
ncbi:MAG: hypothetical protein V3U06_09145 [Candidatus Binatia bacterium]